jgi:hypothetical protein
MRDRVLAVLVTLAVFSAGLLSGLWAERHRPFPAPPGAYMGEFGAKASPPPRPAPAVNRAQLRDQIEKLGPEMDAFRAKISDIYAQFDRDIEPILTPEQRDTYERVFLPAHRVFGSKPDVVPGDAPLSDEEIEQQLQRPFRTMAYFIIIPMALEHMTSQLKLDEAQREKVKDFLRVRREKFIELMDTAPPPSLMLSRLAPLAQRLGPQPMAPAAEPAH